MANHYFQFKKFCVQQDKTAMRVTTDACLFGAWAADHIANQDAGHILDIGTGTGLLSLMIAQKSTGFVEAIEMDPASFEQAKENIHASVFANRIQVFPMALQDFSPQKSYDSIICNPPFFKNSLQSQAMGKKLAKHEGNLPLEDLLSFIKKQVKPAGDAYILLPAYREKEVENLFRATGLYPAEIVYVQQTPTHPAFRCMYRLQKAETHPNTTRLTIKGSEGKYTDAFTQYLSDYYLQL